MLSLTYLTVAGSTVIINTWNYISPCDYPLIICAPFIPWYHWSIDGAIMELSDRVFVTCQNLQFLASMFVCRFVTSQNFQFLQVCSFVGLLLAKIFNFCKYVRLSVCLSVCLFVRNFFDTGHSFWYIFTKLDPSMYLCHVTMPIVFLGQRSNN